MMSGGMAIPDFDRCEGQKELPKYSAKTGGI